MQCELDKSMRMLLKVNENSFAKVYTRNECEAILVLQLARTGYFECCFSTLAFENF